MSKTSSNALSSAAKKPGKYTGNFDELVSGTPEVPKPKKEKPSRINLAVSPELHRRFKAYAAAQGETMSALLIESIESIVSDE
jgi:hypothetical protein